MQQPKPIILVIEDQPIIRMGAVALLEEAGFDALEAAGADDAIGILEARTDIKLVFTDVEMPGSMDGVKLTHYIRDRWPPVKLLVASGRAIIDESHFPKGTRFFAKPYREDAIIEAIIRLMAETDA